MAGSHRDLNALIGSRICHDLISPLGAIGNGVELLTMTGLSGAPEIALIAESVENANARIRYFRIAFGAASEVQSLGRAEITSILGGITKGGRLRIDWQPEDAVPRLDTKLAFLFILCLETAMPRGGTITVTHRDKGWQVIGEAEKLKIVPELWEVLANPSAETEITSAEVHFPLAAELSRRLKKTVRTGIDANRITISF